ncbi:unnamed protein product, partial [Iphiclides podalirius]
MHALKIKSVFKLSVTNINFKSYISTVNSPANSSSDSTREFKPWQEIPGPARSSILLGHFFNVLTNGSLYNYDGFEMLENLYKQYGPIVKIPGLFRSPNLFILYDAESIAYVLRSENWLPKRPGFQSLEHYRKVYKKNNENDVTGLTTDHGEQWKKLRSMVNPVLMQPKTIKLYSTILDEVAKDMIERMKSNRDENNMIKGDLSEEMNLWALESISVVALGGRLNCFEPNLPVDSDVRKLIHIVHEFFSVADKLDFKPSLWRLYPTKTYKRAMKLYEEQEKLNKKFIKMAMEKLASDTILDKEKGILEKLLEIDEQVAILMASDLLFAGVDTATHTIMPLFYLLATHPEKQTKLREELLSNSEKRSYLKACIKESMRIMPVVSGNIRETSKEYNILGYKIPEQTYLSFAHQYTSLMECHYPRPREYIPERWIADKKDPLYHGNAHPFAYSPFGFGARSCIGRRIAELEIEIFLPELLKTFVLNGLGNHSDSIKAH